MNETVTPLLRVRDWDKLYENNRSRDMKRTSWFPAPNDLSADSYVEIIGHQDGTAHFGVWIAILMVASKAKPRRGLLVKEDGRPHTSSSLARVTRIPEVIVTDALERLLEIGLLEVVGPETYEVNNLPSHPGAGNPQGPARRPQEDAVEGKGTEHHHQEGNGKEKKGTERRSDEFEPEGSVAGSGNGSFQRWADDKATPGEVYASPEDELKAIYKEKAGEPITVSVLDAIRLNLECAGVTMGDFVVEAKKHAAGKWRNPPGFLRDLSKRFRVKTIPAASPVTAAEAAARDYQCPICFSRTPGVGLLLVNRRPVPCSCASPEYIAEQRALGGIPEETQ